MISTIQTEKSWFKFCTETLPIRFSSCVSATDLSQDKVHRLASLSAHLSYSCEIMDPSAYFIFLSKFHAEQTSPLFFSVSEVIP